MCVRSTPVSTYDCSQGVLFPGSKPQSGSADPCPSVLRFHGSRAMSRRLHHISAGCPPVPDSPPAATAAFYSDSEEEVDDGEQLPPEDAGAVAQQPPPAGASTEAGGFAAGCIGLVSDELAYPEDAKPQAGMQRVRWLLNVSCASWSLGRSYIPEQYSKSMDQCPVIPPKALPWLKVSLPYQHAISVAQTYQPVSLSLI
jgi:hypothetical protein